MGTAHCCLRWIATIRAGACSSSLPINRNNLKQPKRIRFVRWRKLPACWDFSFGLTRLQPNLAIFRTCSQMRILACELAIQIDLLTGFSVPLHLKPMVRAVRYPACDAKHPDNWNSIAKGGTKLSNIGRFASVAFVSVDQTFDTASDGPLPLWRGHGVHVNYRGLVS